MPSLLEYFSAFFFFLIMLLLLIVYLEYRDFSTGNPLKPLQMPINPRKELWDLRGQKLQPITFSPTIPRAPPDPRALQVTGLTDQAAALLPGPNHPPAFLQQASKLQQSGDRSSKSVTSALRPECPSVQGCEYSHSEEKTEPGSTMPQWSH